MREPSRRGEQYVKWSNVGQNKPGTSKKLPGLAAALSVRQPTEKDKTGDTLIYQILVGPINLCIQC